MHRPDRFDDSPDPSELPDLPIPRPGEGPAEPAQTHAPISPPRLGGGASFTAASEDDPPLTPPAAQPQLPQQPIPADVEVIEVDRARLETERFTWEIAARLTAGMLSNPDRNHASVKDAMAMFDQFLQEMHAYSKIASEFDIMGDRDRRRRDHTEYFQGQNAHPGADAKPRIVAPVPVPGKQAPPQSQQSPRLGPEPPSQPAQLGPEPPAQPAPAAGYQALPPGARAYVPGSMAGAPPDPTTPEHDEDAA